ncbi:zgc:172076 [Hypomesus transpacificus]|uniref:zgc:172076 n=1 Tax=Hypomesus transpacificus TaxID=137520 RepID=UPI001F07A541|nr:zgc:172076 [Hypomesus transpacificus]
MWKIKPPIVFPQEAKYRPVLESLVPTDPMSLFNLKRGSPEEEFPYLRGNHTFMGRFLTLKMYTRQYHRATQSGVIFDDIIRPGLEEPDDLTGPKSVGCLAGDAQSYILFCDFFDRIIEAYHDHKMSKSQESDFNHDNLKGGDDFDGDYAISCEVSVARCVDDFCFPTHCSRGERRKLLTLAKKALEQLSEEFPGKLYSMEKLTEDQEEMGLIVDAPSSSQFRTGVARDWPDSRAVWVSKDCSLGIWINMEEHIKLVTMRSDANIAEAFKCICINTLKLEALYKKLRHPFIWKQHLGWVVSSPADVGTGLRASVRVRLPHLFTHNRLQDVLKRLRLRMENTDELDVYNVSNVPTIGFNEVSLTQLVVDGVKLLIVMEKSLENGQSIDELVPMQK